MAAEEHVRMQAGLQAFTDNAISKTANFPSAATEKDVADAYLLGWKLGCKGLTVYVTGSRDKVVLETAETAKRKQDEQVVVRIPADLRGQLEKQAENPQRNRRSSKPTLET